MELPNDPDKHIFPDAALVKAQGWERFVREIRGRATITIITTNALETREEVNNTK